MLSLGSGNTVIKSKLITRRMFLITAAQAVVMVGLVGRLISLQINQATKYKSLSDKNRFREWKLAPERGIIKDFFNKELASNEPLYQVHLVPENTKDLNNLFVRLKAILNITETKVSYLKRIISKQKPWEPVIVSENLSWSDFSRVNLFLHELEGVEPIVSVARTYPDNSSAHILGYVSQISAKDLQTKKYLKDLSVPGMAIGKTGLERKLDEKIIGKVGYQRYEVNAFGKRIREILINTGQVGKSFKTTLDYEVQKYTNELLKDKAAAVCVMDVYNGDIVSLVSSPTFEPNAFVHGLDKKYWNSLIKDEKKPLTNKALSGLYPPGSTIKTLVALSALENGIIKPLDSFRCKGKIELYGEKFHCWEKKGHGIVNLRKGIQRSCDVYFYEVARKLGVDRLSETAKRFGLGKKVLKDFVEERSGVVPNTKWKKKFIGQNWYLGETLHSGIGQGYFQSTPIQLCLMTAQIANGGFEIKPRIITDGSNNNLRNYLKFKNENPNQPLPTDLLVANFDLKPLFKNQEHINLIKDAMFSSSNEPGGTSYRHRFENPKYTFAGKTGSSQIKRFTEAQREAEVKQKDIKYKDRDHALFVAFAPYKNPQYAISVLVEHGGSGGKAAAPIARKVIKKVLERHELRERVNQLIGEPV
ncbi:penicillin-binding protein 2 [Candidatus Pelagibacter bacterium]|nr:penicillin-binding protein 2 [Candidatus Pelagibacter bacterium]MDA9619069.1 penicillin-binding protein 2 [Candidatus Pelagibacter bacterium]